MISFLRGLLYAALNDALLLDVNGVGYQVYVPSREIDQAPLPGQMVFLHTYLQVLDNEWKLYGFSTREELELFLKLLSISGLGARSALNILNAMRPDEFYRTLASQDERSLVRIPGIGKKTAQRLLFELRDKMGDLSILLQAGDSSPPDQMEDLFQALEVLGYTRSEVLPIIVQLRGDGELSDQVHENIKKVLRLRGQSLRR